MVVKYSHLLQKKRHHVKAQLQTKTPSECQHQHHLRLSSNPQQKLTKLNNIESLNLLTVDEATKLLKISKSSVYEMVKDGRMSSVKLPGVRRVFIKRSDLENILQ